MAIPTDLSTSVGQRSPNTVPGSVPPVVSPNPVAPSTPPSPPVCSRYPDEFQYYRPLSQGSGGVGGPPVPPAVSYFDPALVTAMDSISRAIDVSSRSEGPGWERPVVPPETVEAEIARLRQEADLLEGVAGKELEVQRLISEANRLAALDSREGVPGAMLDIGLNGREAIVVGDLHGNEAGLEQILNSRDSSGVTLRERLASNRAVLIFAGDAIHPATDPLEAMDSSIRIIERIVRLQTQFPDQVFYTQGNHDVVYGAGEEIFRKGLVFQGPLFRDALTAQRRTAYTRSVQEYFDSSPLIVRVMEGSEVVAIAGHSPVVRGGLTPDQAVSARIGYDPNDRASVGRQLTWNRPGENYSDADVARMRASFGSEGTVFVSGHTPGDTSAWQPGPGQVVLQASVDYDGNLSVVRVAPDSRVEVVDVTGASELAGIDLRTQVAPQVPTPGPSSVARPSVEAFINSEGYQVPLNPYESRPVMVPERGFELSDGGQTYEVFRLGDRFIVSLKPGSDIHMPTRIYDAVREGETIRQGAFELTGRSGGTVEVRFVPSLQEAAAARPVVHYSGLALSDLLTMGETALGPETNRGTFEETARPAPRTRTAETAADVEARVGEANAPATTFGDATRFGLIFGGLLTVFSDAYKALVLGGEREPNEVEGTTLMIGTGIALERTMGQGVTWGSLGRLAQGFVELLPAFFVTGLSNGRAARAAGTTEGQGAVAVANIASGAVVTGAGAEAAAQVSATAARQAIVAEAAGVQAGARAATPVLTSTPAMSLAFSLFYDRGVALGTVGDRAWGETLGLCTSDGTDCTISGWGAERLHTVVDPVADAANEYVVTPVSSAVDTASEAVGSTLSTWYSYDTDLLGIREYTDAVGRQLEEWYDYDAHLVRSAAESVGSAISWAGQEANEGFQWAGHKVGQGVQAVADAASVATSVVSSGVVNLVDAGIQAVSDYELAYEVDTDAIEDFFTFSWL